MSTSAIILMAIGCTGLWGGFIVACTINFRCWKKNKQQAGDSQTENK